MVKAQEWIDKNYPKEKRKDEGVIQPSEILERHLDLSDFPKAFNVWLSRHKLTSLDISENHHLKKVFLDNNKITANLDIFSHTTTIEYLYLGGEEKRNDFVGSLEALKNNEHLTELTIDYNEKITEGLEYLPDLSNFSCKGTVFEEILKPYNYDMLAWKLVNHPHRVATSLDNLIERLDNKIGQLKARRVEGEILRILTDYREKTVQACSHKMVESIVEENKELKNRIEELERQMKQLTLGAKIEIPPKK